MDGWNPQSATPPTTTTVAGEMGEEETRETTTTTTTTTTTVDPTTVAMDVDGGEDATGKTTTVDAPKKVDDDDDDDDDDVVAEDERAKMVNPAPGVLPGDVHAPEGSAVHMTERQLYAFRQQIAAYAHICQQLLQVTSVQAHQQTAYQKRQVDTSIAQRPQVLSSVAHKTPSAPGEYGSSGGRGADKSARGARWTGTPKHYEILEQMFQNGQAPPVREELTRITAELAKHGTIGESNVYNWFQNRRSREKKIQAQALARAAQQQ